MSDPDPWKLLAEALLEQRDQARAERDEWKARYLETIAGDRPVLSPSSRRVAADIHEWVNAAIEHADISGAALGRLLGKRLGRNFDRAAIQKMRLPPAPPGSNRKVKPRRVSADEALAISQITGYPLPAASASTQPDTPSASEDHGSDRQP